MAAAQNFTQQAGPLISRLHKLLRGRRAGVSFDQILDAKVQCERSPKAAQHAFIHKLVCGSSSSLLR